MLMFMLGFLAGITAMAAFVLWIVSYIERRDNGS